MIHSIMIVSIIAIIAAGFELPNQIKKRWKKEVILYVLFLIAGSVLSVYALLEIQLPSPLMIPELMYKPLHRWIYQS
ncbi:hypothetical protein [Paenibacillus paeoniae]|uniref:Uncharacterized protein n=1 Tax=Paenibacillus paeoniae TaxID=2292705 RepID=A0A371PLI3_9BACL|nr:hypothetical protein [Paenibacillus paeoniae]REK76845.1 hypothetical protein DX130_07400 [Paenibacillus paeoniae]